MCVRVGLVKPKIRILTELHTQDADLLVVPGGAKGAETISQNVIVQHLLLKQYQAKKLVGMICAGMHCRCKYESYSDVSCFCYWQ